MYKLINKLTHRNPKHIYWTKKSKKKKKKKKINEEKKSAFNQSKNWDDLERKVKVIETERNELKKLM